MDGPLSRRASGVLSSPDHARRLARGLIALAGALVLSLGIVLVVILGPRGAISRSSIMWRGYEGLRMVLPWETPHVQARPTPSNPFVFLHQRKAGT